MYYVFEDSTSDSNFNTFNNFKSNIIDYISTLFKRMHTC